MLVNTTGCGCPPGLLETGDNCTCPEGFTRTAAAECQGENGENGQKQVLMLLNPSMTLTLNTTTELEMSE